MNQEYKSTWTAFEQSTQADWDAVYFYYHYDQSAFDPEYENKPLTFFQPMLRRVFGHHAGHAELAERREDKLNQG